MSASTSLRLHNFPSASYLCRHRMLTVSVNNVDNTSRQACTGVLQPDERRQCFIVGLIFARRRDPRDRGRVEQCRGSGPLADRKFVRVRLPPTGTLFLFGIVVGVVAPLRLSALVAGTRRSASRRSAARRAAARFHHEMAFKDRARDTRLEHQQQVDTATGSRELRRGSTAAQEYTPNRQRITPGTSRELKVAVCDTDAMRAVPGHFATDSTFNPAQTKVTGRDGCQHNPFDCRRGDGGASARQHSRGRGLQDAHPMVRLSATRPRRTRDIGHQALADEYAAKEHPHSAVSGFLIG